MKLEAASRILAMGLAQRAKELFQREYTTSPIGFNKRIRFYRKGAEQHEFDLHMRRKFSEYVQLFQKKGFKPRGRPSEFKTRLSDGNYLLNMTARHDGSGCTINLDLMME